METRKPSLQSIQYLRGVAAMMVVMHHVWGPPPSIYTPLAGFDGGARGVDIFFVISGFIMYVAARHETPLEFSRRRIVRIVPLYWLATLLMIAIKWSRWGAPPYTAIDLVRSLLFVPFVNPAAHGRINPILIPGWTLNFEMFFYLLFALALFTRRPVLWLSSAIFSLVALGLLTSPSSAAAQTYTGQLMLTFLAGVLLGRWHVARDGDLPKRVAVLAPIGLALLLASQFIPFPQMPLRLIAAMATVIGTLALEGLVRRHPVRLAKIVGDASYSIYLFHGAALAVLNDGFRRLPIGGLDQFGLYVLIAVPMVVATGVAIYSSIERPLQRRLR